MRARERVMRPPVIRGRVRASRALSELQVEWLAATSGGSSQSIHPVSSVVHPVHPVKAVGRD